MSILLPYGKRFIEIKQQKNITVFEPHFAKPLKNPSEKIKQSLKKPYGCPCLAEIVKRRKPRSVCIVISDHTRAVPSKIILNEIIKELINSGINKKGIFILIGNGTHRPTTEMEKLELVGKEILKDFFVFDHKATDSSMLINLENTDFYVNKRYIEADLKIVTGMIEPHFFAGFSGGRKGVCPGIAGMESIKIFHGFKFLESPYTKPGNLQNNPCHIFATEFAKKAGVDFLVNVTINKNKEITGVFSGEIEKAFFKGVDFCKKTSTCYTEKKYPVVITTNGGYPLDIDFYQSVKGMVTALEIVENNGIIICVSECREGIGSKDFKRILLEMNTPEQFIKKIKQPGCFLDVQWGVQPLVHVLRKAKIFLVSGLSKKDAQLCRCIKFSSINQALLEAYRQHGKNVEVAVIPEGPYTLFE